MKRSPKNLPKDSKAFVEDSFLEELGEQMSSVLMMKPDGMTREEIVRQVAEKMKKEVSVGDIERAIDYDQRHPKATFFEMLGERIRLIPDQDK